MSLHKSGAQKRKEKRKRDDNERRGIQTLFQVAEGMKKKAEKTIENLAYTGIYCNSIAVSPSH